MSLSQELAQLESQAGRAWEKVRVLRDERRRFEGRRRSAEVIRPLVEYGEAVAARKRDPDPGLHRELTLNLLETVHAKGLVVEAAGTGLIQVVDPSLDAELAAAEAEHREARLAASEFAAAHAEGLEAERKAREMDRVRDALAGDDPDAFRETLAP